MMDAEIIDPLVLRETDGRGSAPRMFVKREHQTLEMEPRADEYVEVNWADEPKEIGSIVHAEDGLRVVLEVEEWPGMNVDTDDLVDHGWEEIDPIESDLLAGYIAEYEEYDPASLDEERFYPSKEEFWDEETDDEDLLKAVRSAKEMHERLDMIAPCRYLSGFDAHSLFGSTAGFVVKCARKTASLIDRKGKLDDYSKQALIDHVEKQAELSQKKHWAFENKGEKEASGEEKALINEVTLLMAYLVERFGMEDEDVREAVEEMADKDHGRRVPTNIPTSAQTFLEFELSEADDGT